MKFVLVGLINLLALSQGLPSYKEPISFAWLKSEAIKLKVIYKNGHDIINLKEYNPLPFNSTLETEESMKSDCNYLGKMEGESDAEVAVSGCKNSQKYYVTIFCENFLHDKFMMNNGSLSLIEDPFKNATKDDEEFVVPSINETSNARTKRQTSGFPREMTMNIAIGMDSNFVNRRGGTSGAMSEIRRVLTVSQAHYYHRSLTTRIKLKVVSAKYYSRDRWQVSPAGLNALRRYASTDSRVHANAFFTYSTGSGAAGYGYIGSMCGSTSYRVSITRDQNSPSATAGTLSHELGHNLGMRHDFEFSGCTGIMDYGDHPATWSNCSVNSFRSYFNRFNPWCLPSSGGTCRNLHSYCEMLESRYASYWRNLCYYWNWNGRSFVQRYCLKYCRKCQ